MCTLPLFQYPAAVAWVDDDDFFSQTMKSALNIKKIFNCPKDCLKFFATYKNAFSATSFLKGELDNENYDLLQHTPVEFDVTNIVKLYNDPRRLQEIGIIICDYNMPKISGFEICHRLQRLSLKKILLTSVAQDSDAITVLNSKTIDCFVHKEEKDLLTRLQGHIKVLMRQYFCEQTNSLLSHLETNYSLPLSDPIFVAFFDNWCEKNNIKEFYLIDKQGSFLTVNAKDKIRFFVVHTDRSLDSFIKLHGNNCELSISKSIIDRNKIPFFGCGKEAWQFKPSVWEKYFYAPQTFKGREKYYWTVVPLYNALK